MSIRFMMMRHKLCSERSEKLVRLERVTQSNLHIAWLLTKQGLFRIRFHCMQNVHLQEDLLLLRTFQTLGKLELVDPRI